MTRSALLMLSAALLLAPAGASSGASSGASAKAAPAKPASAKAAPKAAPAAAAAFDATNPQGFMDVLTAAGAAIPTRRREEDAVFATVTSAAANFSMQYAGCNAQGRACRAVLLDSALPQRTVTGAQINGFNQSSVMCRLYQAAGGQPHVIYSTLLSKSLTRDDAAMHFQAWQGCLADAQDFLRDPSAYLANAS